jgi:RNA polymerase sigma factor (sigma-70 family)
MSANAGFPDLPELLSRSGWARRLARHLVPVDAEADDLLQDAWLTSSVTTPADGERSRLWLAGVMRVLGLRRARAAGRRRQRESEAAAAWTVAEAGAATPDLLVEQVETQRLLSEALLALPEPYRTTIILRYYEGLSAAEIGRRTEVPAGTVRWRLKEGLDRLRAQLDERSGERRAWMVVLARFGARRSGSTAMPWTAVGLGAAALTVTALLLGRSPLPDPSLPNPAAQLGDSPSGRPALTKERNMNKTIGVLTLAAGLATALDAGGAPAVRAPLPPSRAPRFWVPLGAGPMKGPATAKVTILAFTDYECPHCATGTRTVEELAAAHPGEVRYQIIHRPLPFHNRAAFAARAALAAAEQGKFWEMHGRLLDPQGLDRKDIEASAQAIGLDLAKFRRDVDGPTVINHLDQDEANARSVKVDGVPAFFFNGRAAYGARQRSDFVAMLAEEIAYADEVLKTGVDAANIYNEITRHGAQEMPDPVAISQGGERVQEARRKCLEKDAKAGDGLAGVVVWPSLGVFNRPAELKLARNQDRFVLCLLHELKDLPGGWNL